MNVRGERVRPPAWMKFAPSNQLVGRQCSDHNREPTITRNISLGLDLMDKIRQLARTARRAVKTQMVFCIRTALLNLQEGEVFQAAPVAGRYVAEIWLLPEEWDRIDALMDRAVPPPEPPRYRPSGRPPRDQPCSRSAVVRGLIVMGLNLLRKYPRLDKRKHRMMLDRKRFMRLAEKNAMVKINHSLKLGFVEPGFEDWMAEVSKPVAQAKVEQLQLFVPMGADK